MTTFATVLTVFLGVVPVTPRGAAGLRVAQNWRELGPKERYDTLQNYWQHKQLPQDRQQDIEQRYQRWRNLPPDERERVRQNYERFRQLSPAEQQRFERKYQKWRQGESPPQ
jgi:hypothetical protein